QRFSLRYLQPGLYGSLDQTDCLSGLCGRRELAGIFQHLIKEVLFLKNVVDQTDPERLVHRDSLPACQHLQSPALPDQARQSLGPTHARQQPEIDLRQTESRRTSLGDTDIACERDLETASDGMPVDRGYHELLSVLDPHQRFIAMQTEEVAELRS